MPHRQTALPPAPPQPSLHVPEGAPTPPTGSSAEDPPATTGRRALYRERLGVAVGAHGERRRAVGREYVGPRFLLAWNQRQLYPTSAGQLRICVPVRGRPIAPGIHARLTAILTGRWVMDGPADAPRIRSVVAIVGRGDAHQGRLLTLLLTTTGIADPTTLVGASMGRQISSALEMLDRSAD